MHFSGWNLRRHHCLQIALWMFLACGWATAFALSTAHAAAPKVTEPKDAAEAVARFAPTEDYEPQEMLGWTLMVHRDFLRREPRLAEETLTLLRAQLYQITRMVKADPLARLRQIRIWVELEEPHHPCMAYHPDAGWLREHDMNPDKARCVELANARNFLTWTRQQPWMVLHELAHGYHHQFLADGFDNRAVAEVFKQHADQDQRYVEVLHIDGRKQRHYALSNPMEYFAEATEAYFGTNDFFPFVASELEQHDPEGYRLLETIWGGRQP